MMPPAMRHPRIVPGVTFRGLCRARALIEGAYEEPLTLDKLAREAGLSRFHFIRAFQTVFGETPHQYLTAVRIARAKELLRRPSASVTETCFEVGFSSLGSFSALFARRVGSSPERWRREARRLFPVPAALLRPYVPYCMVLHFGGELSVAAPQFSRSVLPGSGGNHSRRTKEEDP
jgi:AraC-like DNA-binding protein